MAIGDVDADLGDAAVTGASRYRRQRRPSLQRVTVDQLEDEEALLGVLLEPVDRADVRMVERGQQLGLALESGEALLVSEEDLGQHLDRHVAPEPRVGGAIHLSHPAFAELGGDLVMEQVLADQVPAV